MTSIGAVLCGTSAIWLSQAGNIADVNIWMFSVGGSSAFVYLPGLTVVKCWYPEKRGMVASFFNMANGCGRLISGYFSDSIRRSRTMAMSFAGAGFAYLIMPHPAGLWLWAALAAVIGFAFGTLFAVSGPLAGDCFGMTHFGAIFGPIFSAYGLVSGPFGPWLSGHILEVTRSNYTLVFSYLGLMYLRTAGLILLIQPWRGCRL
jgi:OFA family oxalate/formate antiporter-like MFS transporter